MKLPMQITFRHMEPSPAIEMMIQKKAEDLDNFAEDIMGCRIVVEPAGKHHKRGNPYGVKIDLTLAGEEVVATRQPKNAEYKDIRVAIREAFDSARRRLEDYVRRRRGDVKTHASVPHARITKLVPDEDHGFLTTTDGREVYFHRRSVPNRGFNRLQVGAEVTFVEKEGDKGPQASTVKPVGRHHHL